VPDARPARGNMDSPWQRLHSRFVAEVGENDSAEVGAPVVNLLEDAGPIQELWGIHPHTPKAEVHYVGLPTC
jgi:hypothetical protein